MKGQRHGQDWRACSSPGGGHGGLLAARVLSDFYDRVTVVERDQLDDEPQARRGVPQSRQPHVLLARCAEIVEELFPGLLEELVAAGAHRWSDGDLSQFHVVFGGHLLVQDGRIPNPASLINYFASRPLIECQVRRRVRALPNVTVLDGQDLVNLTSEDGRVTGAVLRGHGDGRVEKLIAELVVDATGRGSRTPLFLEQLGYGRPAETELTVRVAYASMPVRIPDGTLRELMVARTFEPGRPHGFMMFRCERDTWIIGAATIGGVEPPLDRAGLLEAGVGLVPGHVLDAARAAEELADVSVHRFPANRWRRYDKMDRTPDGLLVVGDAVCSFNPVYGQGMTIASIEAMTLRDSLRRGYDDLPWRFHVAAAKKIRVAWQTAVGSDLALPEVVGKRSMTMRVTNGFVDRVLAAAESDPFVAQEFLRVTGMVSEPRRMLLPSFLFHVARAGRRHQARHGAMAASSLTNSA